MTTASGKQTKMTKSNYITMLVASRSPAATGSLARASNPQSRRRRPANALRDARLSPRRETCDGVVAEAEAGPSEPNGLRGDAAPATLGARAEADSVAGVSAGRAMRHASSSARRSQARRYQQRRLVAGIEAMPACLYRALGWGREGRWRRARQVEAADPSVLGTGA